MTAIDTRDARRFGLIAFGVAQQKLEIYLKEALQQLLLEHCIGSVEIERRAQSRVEIPGT